MKTKQDFEAAAAIARALPMSERKGKALQFAQQFVNENPKFDTKRFFAACMVDIPASHVNAYLEKKQVEISLREVEFTISYRWNKCDVDAALVPHLSRLCGQVNHTVGKADMSTRKYDVGVAELTPYASDVVAIAHHWADKVKWPNGVTPCGGYPQFVQGYCDAIFKYSGNLNKLQATIAQCEHIIATLIEKHVRYYGEGAIVKNRLVNVWTGTGRNIQRID